MEKICKSTCGSIEAVTKSEVTHNDQGQTCFHVKAEHDTFTFEHRVTVGAEDGQDALVNLSDDDLKQTLQSHLDTIRQQAVDILAARSKVKKFAAELI